MILRAVNYPLFLFSVLLALVGTIALFPMDFAQWRPEWMALVVFYWVLRAPQSFGILTAWVLGLMVDVLRADILGLNALAMAFLAFLVLSAHQRLQMYPLVQQAGLVFLFIGIVQMVLHFVQQMLGEPRAGFDYLFPAITSALIWPVFQFVWDGINSKLG